MNLGVFEGKNRQTYLNMYDYRNLVIIKFQQECSVIMGLLITLFILTSVSLCKISSYCLLSNDVTNDSNHINIRQWHMVVDPNGQNYRDQHNSEQQKQDKYSWKNVNSYISWGKMLVIKILIMNAVISRTIKMVIMLMIIMLMIIMTVIKKCKQQK